MEAGWNGDKLSLPQYFTCHVVKPCSRSHPCFSALPPFAPLGGTLWPADVRRLAPTPFAEVGVERLQAGEVLPLAGVWALDGCAPLPLALAPGAPQAQQVGLVGIALAAYRHSSIP